MKLSHQALSELLNDSEIINRDGYGIKVIKLENGRYFKIFRVKKLLSSGIWQHYADRFTKNSIILKKLNIPSVQVLQVYSLPKDFIKKSYLTKAVEYNGIEGPNLREYIADCQLSLEQSQNLARELLQFVNKLHSLGVYFRAIHFGNLIYNSSFPDKFGLIDIDNMSIYSRPLSKRLQMRNYQHLMAYEQDKQWLQLNLIKTPFISDGCKA